MKAHNIIRHVARLYSYATANKTVEEVGQYNIKNLATFLMGLSYYPLIRRLDNAAN